ncbi:MAG: hypothetical protein J2P25_14215 [Nocardiopsaceae bacterium]|nr:hypothetical protein [Nocardiopsaceae bacterium]
MRVSGTRGNFAQGNSGVQNIGSGSVSISNSAIGAGATAHVGTQPRTRADRRDSAGERGADVGIITVLPKEKRAMAEALADAAGGAGKLRPRVRDDGFRYDEADIDIGDRTLRAVLTQADEPGQRPTAIAFGRLCENYAPALVALVGIAGGIHPALRPGDVVVAQEVIYYEPRKVTPKATFRRGEARAVPGSVRRALNDFFSQNGGRASVGHPDGTTRECAVLPGPIGSGEAVVAAADSEIREYVRSVNDKVLALETEAGGLAEAFHETADGSATSGWLVVRGISDLADVGKDDMYHEIASRHAAAVLLRMLPDLFRKADPAGAAG